MVGPWAEGRRIGQKIKMGWLWGEVLEGLWEGAGPEKEAIFYFTRRFQNPLPFSQYRNHRLLTALSCPIGAWLT
jgi:hypothetical protein